MYFSLASKTQRGKVVMLEHFAGHTEQSEAPEMLHASCVKCGLEIVGIARTTPTRLPDALRAASRRALDSAADPLNKLDYNPCIAEEWTIVANELWAMAARLEQRLGVLFKSATADN
jgi:hypothetical protein